MDLLRGLQTLFRKVRPPTVYLVARLRADGSASVAAFRDPDGAARCLVQQARRRAGRPGGSSNEAPAADDIIQAFQSLNTELGDGTQEYWSVTPAELVPPGEEPVPFRLQVVLFDLSGIEDDEAPIATCDLPGLRMTTTGELDRHDHTRPADRPASAPDTIEQVYLATEWTADTDICCHVFEDSATAKRFTIQWYNEDVMEETDDFRTAFRGLNRADGDGFDDDDDDDEDDDEDDESAFSLSTVRLGRDRFVLILNGAASAGKAGASRGFCDLPDTRIGQAMTPDE